MDQLTLNTAICEYITHEVISRCELTKGISINRRNTLINNNVSLVMEAMGDNFRSPILQVATQHYSNIIRNNPKDTTLAIKEAIDEGHSPLVANQLMQLVDVLVSQLDDATNKMRETHTQVSELTARYETQLKNLLSPTSEKVLDESPIHYETWSNIDIMGPEDQIILELNLGEDKTTPNIRSLNNYINQIELQIEKHDVYPHYTPSSDLTTKIKEKVETTAFDNHRFMTYLKDVSSRRGVYNHLSILSSYKQLGMNVDHFTKIQEHVRRLSSWLRTYDKVCGDNKLNSYIDNKLVHRNVSLLSNVIKGMVYAMSYYRYSIWGNALILPNGKVNQDLIVAAFNKGITKDDIRTFIHFTKGKTSHSLMTVDYFLKEKDTYARMLANEVKDRAMSNKDNTRSAKQAAFSNVASRFTKQHGLDNGMKDMVTGLASGIAHNTTKSATSGFYKVVQEAMNFSESDRQLFDELGTAYSTVMEADNGSVDKRTIEETNVLVISKLVAKKLSTL